MDPRLPQVDFGLTNTNHTTDGEQAADIDEARRNNQEVDTVIPVPGIAPANVVSANVPGQVDLAQVMAGIEAQIAARLTLQFKEGDTRLEFAEEKRENTHRNTALHEELAKAKSDIKSLTRDRKKQQRLVDKLVKDKCRIETECLELVQKTTAWFAALSVNEDPRRDMLAFLERMKDQGGSLFRDGLVIPEGPEEVESGEMDEDSDLEIIT